MFRKAIIFPSSGDRLDDKTLLCSAGPYLVQEIYYPNGHLKTEVQLSSETSWSVTLRDENRLTEFENRARRRTFGSKRNYVTGDRTHSEELYNAYSTFLLLR
jgi:hypothetical protein